jgi:hypothetical protein
MKIKSMMLEKSLGNEAFLGVRVGHEAESIEGTKFQGVPCFKVVLNKRHNHGIGFGDWLIMPANVRYIELYTPEEEEVLKEAEKAEAEAKK